ncbi:MAG: cytochrome c oxidase accessory protein CcoG [Bacteroidota bacterium]
MNEETIVKDSESFRDSIATIDDKGHRAWIYPKKPKGRYYRARSIVSIVLLAVLFGMPFIKINGDPFFMFNVIERKFILFGIIFLPQDFHLFGLAMITIILFIALFTAVFGRLFCGWVCPQTIFMEMVFRKIEYWIEGDANKQRKLNRSPWTFEKYWKKGLKLSIFFTIAVLIANTFLAWIIGTDEVIKIISEPISAHMSGFIAMIIFSGVFFFVFTWFREQVCIAVCPYGRMQGVLLDKDSIVVHYDHIRGEPRGKIRKNKLLESAEKLGDCIDCKLCVQVCPTGIDIRNGTQLECVNCTACIDACDEVMEKVKRPKGLIRYASLNNIEKNVPFKLTKRAIAYSAVLVILLTIQGFLLVNRSDLEVTILRTPGTLYYQSDDGYISNLYKYRVANKTNDEMDLELRIKRPEGRIRMNGESHKAVAQGSSEGNFFIDIKDENVMSDKVKVILEVFADGEKFDQVKATFLGPIR